jgi:hypothetical protein
MDHLLKMLAAVGNHCDVRAVSELIDIVLRAIMSADLFIRSEHEGDVRGNRSCDELAEEVDHDRVLGFHVARAAANEPATLRPRLEERGSCGDDIEVSEEEHLVVTSVSWARDERRLPIPFKPLHRDAREVRERVRRVRNGGAEF